MKKWLAVLALGLALVSLPAAAEELSMRGCWVSTVYNLDYPSSPGLSAQALADEADALIAQAREDGINTLFLQVRPCADALYPSALFPWSAYLSGAQGQAPDGGFDALGYFLTRCHENGLALHAWINPYRVTRQAAGSMEEALALLAPGHPVRAMEDCLLLADDGCLYLDPGRPESRALILDGIRELLTLYPVDGVQFDDYFYPSAGYDDSATLALCGEGYADADAFRRASVDTLIEQVHALCAELRPAARFGISPFGIWATAARSPLGAETAGGSSYFDHCADSRKWVREGMVDYILPQLYWAIGAKEGAFDVLLRWWSELVEGTDVELYIGLAAYRAVGAEEGSPWYGGAELARQLAAIVGDPRAAGAALFRWGSLRESPALAQAATEVFVAARDRYLLPRSEVTRTLLPLSPLTAGWLLEGEDLRVQCAAPPGSRVRALCGESGADLAAQADGSYAGTLVPPAPAEGESARGSAVLVTCERGGFVWVRLLRQAVHSVARGEALVLTEVTGQDEADGSHTVLLETDGPCAVQAQVRGDVLTLTLAPVRMAVLFEDAFFSSIRLSQAGERAEYALSLPGSGADYRYAIEWSERAVLLRLTRR